MNIELHEGSVAPDFSGTDQNGQTISLSGFRGSKVVLYFYPKDNTPGCTAEACSLRDGYDDLTSMGYKIIGISPDSLTSHSKFAQKHNLNFHLLSDNEKTIIAAYGAWGEKKMCGRTYMGVIRTTFLIDENGVVAKVIKKVDTKNHAEQIKKLIAEQ